MTEAELKNKEVEVSSLEPFAAAIAVSSSMERAVWAAPLFLCIL